jgi:glycosyltransferase involved in cell wall biosynthesis
MIRVGFDAKRLFNNNTGLGNYSRTLVRSLHEYYPDNEYVLFTPRVTQGSLTSYFTSGSFELHSPGAMPGWLWRSLLMNKDINKADLDIYHGLSHELPVGIHKTNTCSIVTIHDIIYRFHPEDFPLVDRKIYDYKFRYACEHSDRIIAVSQSTKADIIMHYGIAEEKISVVYQSCSESFKQGVTEEIIESTIKKYNLPKQFLLYVGTVNERKNLMAAVKAVGMLKDTLKLPLLVVGSGTAYKQKVADYVKKNNLESKVIFAPYVQNEDLPAIYHRARIMVFPSRYEGFGIPVIEALYSRTPVITSRMSSLPEAAGPGAHYIDPDDPSTIADGIVKILTSPEYYKQLITNGYNHVQQFNNRDISKLLIGIYERTSRGK